LSSQKEVHLQPIKVDTKKNFKLEISSQEQFRAIIKKGINNKELNQL
jgi:hypothetical protein